MKYALAIVAVLLFCFNYQICCIVHPFNIDAWWSLKQNIYNSIIAICFYLAGMKATGFNKLILEIGIGFCVSNCIDRLLFNVTTFEFADIVMISATLIISTYRYFKQWRKTEE